MECTTSQSGASTILYISGSLQAQNADQFEKLAMEAAESTTGRLILDFSKVNYISSAGLRVIAKLMRLDRFQATPGNLVLCGLVGEVRKVFEMTGMIPRLSAFDSVEAAVQGA